MHEEEKMKKRILSAGCILAICLTLGIQVNAMDNDGESIC